MAAKSRTISELNKIFSEAEEVDKELFAEMRSNLLLIAGEHYAKPDGRIARNIRTTGKTSTGQASDQKLRLTKNHTHKVHRSYKTAILAEAPSTTVGPKNPTEIQDQESAQLNEAVWVDVKYRHEMDARIDDWASQFVGIGELCVKLFWDPTAGDLQGYEPLVDEQTGQPVMEPTGEIDPQTGQPGMKPKDDKDRPKFSGDFAFEDVYGMNLMRECGTQNMRGDKERCWIIRKMVDTEELKEKYKDDEDKFNKILEGKNETYIVFDSNRGTYEKKTGQTMVREFYWEPCGLYPEGYFTYTTPDVILEEDVLPGGIFPLVWEGFDTHPSTPRGHSIIKVARPYQAEMNRASSQMAVAQITLGDDKILYQAGSKLGAGALLPGVRGIAYQGREPIVLPGRTGAQYLEYVQSQEAEMYRVLMIDDNEVLDKSGQIDPYALLFRAASKKRKFGPYAAKFERFLVRLTQKTLELAKFYLPDDALIFAVGRRETINIPEFRQTSPLSCSIKVEPRSEDIETQFGKQLTFQNLLQYAGKQLDPKTLGKLAKNLPFANWEDAFDDLTVDEDVAKNDMLALERGQQRQASKYMDASYMIKKLTGRMKKPDFEFLAPPVQQAYQALLTQYEQIDAQKAAQLKAMQNEYIPVDGALVTCDMYVQDKAHPENEAKRVKLPQRALAWLQQRLEEQGMTTDAMEGMNAQSLSDMANMILSQKAQAAGQGNGQQQAPPQAGVGRPQA